MRPNKHFKIKTCTRYCKTEMKSNYQNHFQIIGISHCKVQITSVISDILSIGSLRRSQRHCIVYRNNYSGNKLFIEKCHRVVFVNLISVSISNSDNFRAVLNVFYLKYSYLNSYTFNCMPILFKEQNTHILGICTIQ